jgi:hypothetical protein
VGTTKLSATFLETGLVFINDSSGRIEGLRGDAGSIDWCVATTMGAPTVVASPANLATTGSDLFFGDSGGVARAFSYIIGTGWAANSAWGGGTGYVGVGTTSLGGLALGTGVIGTVKLKGAFDLALSDGSLTGHFPNAGTSSNPGAPVVGSTGTTYFGDGTNQLLMGNPASSTLTGSASSGAVIASPALGQGGLVYALNQSGELWVFNGSLAPQWAVQLPGASSFTASPNLDCHRDATGAANAGPGVLYAASTAGTIYAILVDSHGLDSSAPWPKYQHDSRNTGNRSTPLSPCP